ncbi:putative fungal pheromone GPCR, STE3-type [Amylocystis lapponica]|nr:putative fungal pheromone GPCR, STE3-type [Amylocystis lapponica]
MSVAMPFASFLAAVVVLVPLPWHWRARNIPTLSMICWLFVVNVINVVDTIVWARDAIVRLVVWCNITTKIGVGANVALPAACFCLCMHLESVASGRRTRITASDKRRQTIVDLCICVGIPIIYMALHYIVQGHLFDIVEGFGCRAEDYVSIPEFFLMWLTPILFCIGTFIFSGFAFVHFYHRRASFAQHLAHTTSALTPARYLRLMAMSLVEMFWAITIITINLSFEYRAGLRPWISWDNVHSDFSRIGQFPLILLPASTLRWTSFLWWSTPISAYIFFIFFAFGQDALQEYGACAQWVGRTVFRMKPDAKPLASFGSFAKKSLRLISPLPPHRIDVKVEKFALDDGLRTPTDSDAGFVHYRGLSSTTTSLSCYAAHEDGKKPLYSATGCGLPETPSTPSSLPPSPVVFESPPPAVILPGSDRIMPLSRYAHTDQVV